MPKQFHLGFEIHDSCQCLNIGADGTHDHRGSLTLIEISSGLSKGRRTKSCENHLANYIRSGHWIVIEQIKDIVVTSPVHEHVWSKWAYNHNGGGEHEKYWRECDCGEIDAVLVHDPKDASRLIDIRKGLSTVEPWVDAVIERNKQCMMKTP